MTDFAGVQYEPFEVAEENIMGTLVERLNIEARTFSGRLTMVALWADGKSWLYCRDRKAKAPGRPTAISERG